jgi:hypothetical protein
MRLHALGVLELGRVVLLLLGRCPAGALQRLARGLGRLELRVGRYKIAVGAVDGDGDLALAVGSGKSAIPCERMHSEYFRACDMAERPDDELPAALVPDEPPEQPAARMVRLASATAARHARRSRAPVRR